MIIGGIAMATSTTKVGNDPMNEKAPDGSPSPKICTMRMSNANEGSALPMFEMLTVAMPPFRT